MLLSHLPQVSLEALLDGNRQHRPPVFLAFTPSNDNFTPVKAEVLYSKLQTLLQPQPGDALQTPNVVPFPEGSRPKLLDQVRDIIRMRHYSRRTETTYVHWIRRHDASRERTAWQRSRTWMAE